MPNARLPQPVSAGTTAALSTRGAEQAALIRAALFDGEDALAAWREWRAVADLDDLDAASDRLLPLLYRNLVRFGVDDPWLGRLRGIYRFHWVRNQVLKQSGASALVTLAEAGIDTVVLKGAALGELHYRGVGLRPMNDVDILVPRARALDAMNALQEAGYTPDMPKPQARLAVRALRGLPGARGARRRPALVLALAVGPRRRSLAGRGADRARRSGDTRARSPRPAPGRLRARSDVGTHPPDSLDRRRARRHPVERRDA